MEERCLFFDVRTGFLCLLDELRLQRVQQRPFIFYLQVKCGKKTGKMPNLSGYLTD
jgi:hypothetical protein